MIGRRRESRIRAGRILLSLMVVLVLSACASAPRSPFGGTGPVHLTVVNNARQAVSATLLGIGEPIELGVFLGGQSRFLEFTMEGRGEVSVQLERLNGGETYETFRTAAEPGDRLLLEIETDLKLARLIRTRLP